MCLSGEVRRSQPQLLFPRLCPSCFWVRVSHGPGAHQSIHFLVGPQDWTQVFMLAEQALYRLLALDQRAKCTTWKLKTVRGKYFKTQAWTFSKNRNNLGMSPKKWQIILHKSKRLLHSKRSNKPREHTAYILEQIFVHYTSDRELISRICI